MHHKRKNLQKRLDTLSEDLEVAYRQQGKTLNDVNRKRLGREIEDIEQAITGTEAQLRSLSDTPHAQNSRNKHSEDNDDRNGNNQTETNFHGSVTGPVHTGSGDINIYGSTHTEQDDVTNTAVFHSLIQEKTTHFIGRQHVFTAVSNFITNAPNGYFLIEGEPGIGKSAILARYVQQTACPAYFNIRTLGNNTPHDFLNSICRQLIDRYDLPYQQLPPDATKDGRFLTRLLKEIVPRLSARNPLIIAVDALDEVDQNRVASGENLLYLPPYLPEHIFFIVTQRPMPHSFITYEPLHQFDLMDYTTENRADVAAFINQFTRRSRLQMWLTQQTISSSHFIQTLTSKSEDNFMYLRHVLHDIEYGIYRDATLDQLPAGLLPYYADHWQRMGMQADPLPRTKLTIIYILCEAQQPISPMLIANFSVEDSLIVQTVINEWRQFLHRYPFKAQYKYALYHHSFRDFLHQQEIIQATGLTLPDINAQIADYLWDTMFDDQ